MWIFLRLRFRPIMVPWGTDLEMANFSFKRLFRSSEHSIKCCENGNYKPSVRNVCFSFWGFRFTFSEILLFLWVVCVRLWHEETRTQMIKTYFLNLQHSVICLSSESNITALLSGNTRRQRKTCRRSSLERKPAFLSFQKRWKHFSEKLMTGWWGKQIKSDCLLFV